MRTMMSAVMGVALMMMAAFPVMAQEKKADRPGGAMIEATTISATVEAID
jgi:hypothetical protein